MQESMQEGSIVPASRPRARYSAWFKLLAVLVALAGALNAAQVLLGADTLRHALEPSDYVQSDAYAQRFYQLGSVLAQVAFQTAADDEQARAQLRTDYEDRVDTLSKAYAEAVVRLRTGTEDSDLTEADIAATYRQNFQSALNDYNGALQRLEQNRRSEISSAAQADEVLKNAGDMNYTAVGPDGDILTTNIVQTVQGTIGQYYNDYPHRLQIEGGTVIQGPDRMYWLAGNVPEGYSLYVAMPESAYNKLSTAYIQAHEQAMSMFWRLLAGAAATLAGLVWLLYAAGRRPAAAGVVLLATDRVYLDIQLVLYGVVFGICFLWCVNLVNDLTWNYIESFNSELYQIGIQALFAVVLLSGVLFITSVAKRAKRGELLRHTLVFVFLRAIWRGLKRLVMGLKASTRHVLAFIGFVLFYGLIAMSFGTTSTQYYLGALSVFLFMLGFVLAVIALSFVLHKVISFKNLSTAVRRIQAGELGVRVPTGGGADFAQLAHSVNNLADGLKAAVDSEVKAERMRAELVTNVSHDLKTPLTSIVTYVDLLKTEGLTSENAPHYLDVIDQKAARLKTLTADLFEAAKAASGTMPVNLERVDANALLAQGLSELSDRILASGLDMKLQLPADRLLLRADGRLLWRVMENLLSNVFKYALKGSRVYLSAGRQGGRGVLTLKNISAYELNIAPEELTERFTRGDASRHSEGSGLGLSIARSLSELQGGELRIEIDGDLFKAIVSLPVWED